MSSRTRLHRTLLRLEERSVQDYVEASSAGGDPERLEYLLNTARRLSQLRDTFGSGIIGEALATEG